jgi:hypothetical protein
LDCCGCGRCGLLEAGHLLLVVRAPGLYVFPTP